jgi:hypothetical protein
MAIAARRLAPMLRLPTIVAAGLGAARAALYDSTLLEHIQRRGSCA